MFRASLPLFKEINYKITNTNQPIRGCYDLWSTRSDDWLLSCMIRNNENKENWCTADKKRCFERPWQPARCTIESVEHLFIIDFNEYVQINFDVLVVLNFNDNVLVIFYLLAELDLNVKVLINPDVLVVLDFNDNIHFNLTCSLYSFWSAVPRRQHWSERFSSWYHSQWAVVSCMKYVTKLKATQFKAFQDQLEEVADEKEEDAPVVYRQQKLLYI